VLAVDKLQGQVVYLAAPYSHSDPAVVAGRMDQVAEAMTDLMQAGVCVVSPLSFHWVSERIQHPLDWQHFEHYCRTLLSRCDIMVIVALEGWQQSTGVTAELDAVRQAGKACYLYNPETTVLTEI